MIDRRMSQHNTQQKLKKTIYKKYITVKKLWLLLFVFTIVYTFSFNLDLNILLTFLPCHRTIILFTHTHTHTHTHFELLWKASVVAIFLITIFGRPPLLNQFKSNLRDVSCRSCRPVSHLFLSAISTISGPYLGTLSFEQQFLFHRTQFWGHCQGFKIYTAYPTAICGYIKCRGPF